VGTPPHVAPEALLGRPLDQRTDLYGLGTILYWLLTGTHAYPARNLRDLPGLWVLPIPSVGDLRARLGEEAGEAVPAELDALVMSLISENPMARPNTTGEVIDLLSALLGIESERRSTVDEVALQQPALVGRERERSDWQRRLEQAGAGRGECTIYEGQRGAGRSRMLLELSTDARILGFSVLHVGAKECVGNHGVAESMLIACSRPCPMWPSRPHTHSSRCSRTCRAPCKIGSALNGPDRCRRSLVKREPAFTKR
jgi:serine/threonine protein kinase